MMFAYLQPETYAIGCAATYANDRISGPTTNDDMREFACALYPASLDNSSIYAPFPTQSDCDQCKKCQTDCEMCDRIQCQDCKRKSNEYQLLCGELMNQTERKTCIYKIDVSLQIQVRCL